MGDAYGSSVIIQNCFATGDVLLTSDDNKDPSYRGGLMGHVFFATVNNCYATGKVEYARESSYIGRVIGCPQEAHLHYLYGRDDINTEHELMGNRCADASNIVAFHHEASQNTLATPVAIDGQEYSDLNDALNAWVTSQNDEGMKAWALNDTGYPVQDAFFALLAPILPTWPSPTPRQWAMPPSARRCHGTSRASPRVGRYSMC